MAKEHVISFETQNVKCLTFFIGYAIISLQNGIFMENKGVVNDESIWEKTFIQSEKNWLSPKITENYQSKTEEGKKENFLRNISCKSVKS